ncbi:MAG TPA: hypothetical protein VFW21_01585 [Mycobacterium sp.]|nr:hypothetical protein [Mycobacterium sp.]
MSKIKIIATGSLVAAGLGLAALGVGTGVANAAPSPVVSSSGFAQWGWQPGPGGHGWGGPGGPGWDGPGPAGWAPPPPPPPAYGYGGYGYGAPCLSGPLGFVRVCA